MVLPHISGTAKDVETIRKNKPGLYVDGSERIYSTETTFRGCIEDHQIAPKEGLTTFSRLSLSAISRKTYHRSEAVNP